MIRDLSNIIIIAAMQRALGALGSSRIGSARERYAAYRAAGIDRDVAFKFDAAAWKTERIRRRVMRPELKSILERAA